MANPVEKTNKAISARVSTQRFLIAGLNVTVHGLSELRSSAKQVACLWVQHPRLGDAQGMAPVTATLVTAWNSTAGAARLGLIGVTIDQRNHGSRLQKHLYNTTWRDGNETHAPDMFSALQGTMLDTRQLIEYLPAYVFPEGQRTIAHHLTFGISLGGHAVWQLLMHEPRIRAGVVIIGGPDYALFMQDRARLSRRRSWARGQGARFFGSVDFPSALVDAIARWDPAGVLLGGPRERGDDLTQTRDPASEEERAHVAERIKHHLGGKHILCLSGAQDKLVPPHLAKPFMDWLKRAIGHGSSGSTATAKSTTSNDPQWKAGAGRGWMVSEGSDGSSGAEASQQRWKGPEWTAAAGSGWMVSNAKNTGKAAGEGTSNQNQERWKGPDWRAGAGAGWMTTAPKTAGTRSEGGWMDAGWAGDTGIVLEDILVEGAGHECTPSMVAEASRFIVKEMEALVNLGGGGERAKL